MLIGGGDDSLSDDSVLSDTWEIEGTCGSVSVLAGADGVAGTATEKLAFGGPVVLDRLGDGREFPSNVLVAGSGLRDEAAAWASVASEDGGSFN